MDYDVLLLSLALDLAAISVLTYAIYFRRHQRRDLTLGFMGVNVGLFSVASYISTHPVGVGFGIGLFALLSVIRLRSTQITQEEIGYYFVAIVIGLATGLSPGEHWAPAITLTVVLVLVMYVVDHPRLLPRYDRRIVRLKSVYVDDADLHRVLEEKLGGRVVKTVVLDIDFVQKQMRVDVRFRPDPPGSHPRVKKADRDAASLREVPLVVPGVDGLGPTQAPPDDAGDGAGAEEMRLERDEDPGAQQW